MWAKGSRKKKRYFYGQADRKGLPPKMVIFKLVAKGCQGSLRVAKGFQGPRGTPGMGEMSYNQIDHI